MPPFAGRPFTITSGGIRIYTRPWLVTMLFISIIRRITIIIIVDEE